MKNISASNTLSPSIPSPPTFVDNFNTAGSLHDFTPGTNFFIITHYNRSYIFTIKRRIYFMNGKCEIFINSENNIILIKLKSTHPVTCT